MTAYYNEIDPKCVAVLRRHIQLGNLPPGDVDDRDIREVNGYELKKYDEVHLFAGIGGFPLGFYRSGFRNTTGTICTGGFPCQDLSVAGKRAGLDGERSGLWFEFARIIAELGPRGVVVENVPGLLSSDDGRDFAIIIRWMVKRGYGVAWRVLDAQYFGLAQRRRRVFVVASLGNGSAAEVLFEREGVRWDLETLRAQRKVAPTLPASGAGTQRDAEPEFYIEEEAQKEIPEVYGIDSEQNVIENGMGTIRAHKSGGSELHVAQIYQWASGGGDDLKDSAQALRAGAEHNYQIVAIQQNTRDEVRIVNGDGAIAGAIAAEPGAKQQNYVAEVSGTITSHLSRQRFGSNPIPGLMVADEVQGTRGALQARDGKGIATTIDDKLVPIAWMESAGGGQGGKGFHGKEDHTFALSGYVQRVGVRRLTPTECERLQGFPDGWTLSGVTEKRAVFSEEQSLGDEAEIIGWKEIPLTDSTRYRQLGNAVPVNVTEWIGQRMKDAFG